MSIRCPFRNCAPFGAFLVHIWCKFSAHLAQHRLYECFWCPSGHLSCKQARFYYFLENCVFTFRVMGILAVFLGLDVFLRRQAVFSWVHLYIYRVFSRCRGSLGRFRLLFTSGLLISFHIFPQLWWTITFVCPCDFIRWVRAVLFPLLLLSVCKLSLALGVGGALAFDRLLIGRLLIWV